MATSRLLIEFFAAVGLSVLLLIAYRQNWATPATLITVCLLLARILPSVVSVKQSYQQVQTAVPAYALWQQGLLDPHPERRG